MVPPVIIFCRDPDWSLIHNVANIFAVLVIQSATKSNPNFLRYSSLRFENLAIEGRATTMEPELAYALNFNNQE
jgi:hypothetical protein